MNQPLSERPAPQQEEPSAPEKSAQPRSRLSLKDRMKVFPITFTLIGITLLFFIIQSLSDAIVGVDLVLIYGAKYNEGMLAGEWWRLVTPIFVHAGVMHFGVNMYSLYAIGPAVEGYFGKQRFILVYLLSGIGGVIFSFGFTDAPSVGASGAIFGLVGALGGFYYFHRKLLRVQSQLNHLIMVTLMNLLLGTVPGIDNWGHIGGLLTGFGLSWWLGPRLGVVRNELEVRLKDQQPFSDVKGRIPAAAAALLLILVVMIIL